MSKVTQQINQILIDTIKNKHTDSYFLQRCYKSNNLLIYANKEQGEMTLFRELYYFYNKDCFLNVKNYEDYTLCFWNDGYQCFKGIYNIRNKKVLNQFELNDSNPIISSLSPYTYTN